MSQKKSVFRHYLHFYVSYDHNFFTHAFPWYQGMFSILMTHVWDNFAQLYSCLKLRFLPENAKNSERTNLSESHSDFILKEFWSILQFTDIISASTCRTTIIFYWRISLMPMNVFNTQNACLRKFLANLQLFKLKVLTKKYVQTPFWRRFW